MTIAIAGNFSEGVVFGADSAVTCRNQNGILNVLNGAQKIYHIGEARDCSDSPYGAMIYGSAQHGGECWRNILANFWKNVKNNQAKTCELMADQFIAFLSKEYNPSEGEKSGGMFFAGYGPEDKKCQCFKINLQNMQKKKLAINELCYDGMYHVVYKLLNGLDENIESIIQNTFKDITIQKYLPDKTTKLVSLSSTIIETIRDKGMKCQFNSNLSLRDAIDFVHFLVYTTIKHFKFALTAPVCGGEIEIVAITLDRGFRRIKRKALDSEIN